jgi:hypothetical protein
MTLAQVVLHVGAHKTGTSLIQRFFEARPGFCQRHQIHCIRRSETNRLIGWGTRLESNPDGLRDRIREECERAGPYGMVLLSHENSLGRPFLAGQPGLYPEADRWAQVLRSALPDVQPRVIFYLRPLAAYVESYYLQTVQEGASHSFAEWETATVDVANVSWKPVVDALVKHFGQENVDLGDFRELEQGQDEFLRGFIGRLGIDLAVAPHYARIRNRSLSARGLQMALAINPMLRTLRERKSMRRYLQANFNNADDERARPMPDELRLALDNRDKAEYDALLRDFEHQRQLLTGDGARRPERPLWRKAVKRTRDLMFRTRRRRAHRIKLQKRNAAGRKVPRNRP